MTRLTSLSLVENSFFRDIDIVPLAGLTQLTFLDLSRNSISDLTPLAGLIQLNRLILVNNLISDISPLVANTGLGAGDLITLSFNPLDTGDCANIQTLIDRGTSVSHKVACP